MQEGIYLDNSMTTRPSERSVSKMMPFLRDKWGVPASPHKLGFQLNPSIKESLEAVYALLNANHDDDFVFTSSGAEAVNHIIQSIYFDQTLESGRNHVITSNIDEAPAIMAIGRLEEMNCSGKMVHANAEGMVTADAIADAITPRTILVSLSWANGLTGVINPVEEIASICQERGLLFHLDATHVLGKLFFELDDIGATHITFNGDNLHAPKGTGGLLIRKERHCSPFILGGIEQGGLRAGSYSIANLVALGEAAVEALDARDFLCTEVARLRDKFEEGIVAGYSQARVLFKDSPRVPNITAIAFPGIANEALLYALNSRGVYGCIGGGSFQQIGLVVKACGVEESIANSVVSFSLSRETTESEIDGAIQIVVEEALRLQKMSEMIVKG